MGKENTNFLNSHTIKQRTHLFGIVLLLGHLEAVNRVLIGRLERGIVDQQEHTVLNGIRTQLRVVVVQFRHQLVFVVGRQNHGAGRSAGDHLQFVLEIANRHSLSVPPGVDFRFGQFGAHVHFQHVGQAIPLIVHVENRPLKCRLY